jgi:hypothetical protein
MGKRPAEAMDAFQHSVQLQPRSIDAISHLANVQFKLLYINEATASYSAAYALDPTRMHLLGKAAHTQQFSCDWGGFERSWPLLLRALQGGKHSCLLAFEALAMPTSAELLLAVSRAHAGDQKPFDFPKQQLVGGPGSSSRGGNSGDFSVGSSSRGGNSGDFSVGSGSSSNSSAVGSGSRPPLRVGYVSSDFSRHPVMTVAGGMFEKGAHDR